MYYEIHMHPEAPSHFGEGLGFKDTADLEGDPGRLLGPLLGVRAPPPREPGESSRQRRALGVPAHVGASSRSNAVSNPFVFLLLAI